MNFSQYERRKSHTVRVRGVEIGGQSPICVQSMTNTSTLDTERSVEQIERIYRAGAQIVRLTAQGEKEAENLQNIVREVRARGLECAIVADIHFQPKVAITAAQYVDKVRINPGNFSLKGDYLHTLIDLCRQRGAAIRVGVNHGSLAQHILDEYGDSPQGMVASAMEFLRIAQSENFDQVVVSMKSSNTRVMVYAYRLLAEAMEREGMSYPLHLGVTEAGDGIDGRIKSAVGIGALLADGIGDTIRVSLTESPENEVPVAQALVDHFRSRSGSFDIADPSQYSYTAYRCRSSLTTPATQDEIDPSFTILTSTSENPTAELRAAILNLHTTAPVAICRRYEGVGSLEELAIKAAADLGLLFLDGLADGICIQAEGFSPEQIKSVELSILQAARRRQSKTEYISCPSCGRTLYDIESTLQAIKARTAHLSHLKIGIMGCIVNGPGEMADADYGYVGAAAGRITLYKGSEVIERNIPQQEALDRLIELIKQNGDWVEPMAQ